MREALQAFALAAPAMEAVVSASLDTPSISSLRIFKQAQPESLDAYQ